MKALRNPAMLVSLFALQACSVLNFWSEPQTDQASQPLAALDQPNSIKPQTFILRGEVILGHEAQSIQPCGSEQQYWLAMDKDKFQQAMHLIHTPYQPMYGEMVGHLETASLDGIEGDYSARFVVSQVNLLSAENPNRCGQPQQPTQAFGNEPFWSLSLESNQLTFRPMGGQKLDLPITNSRIEPDRHRYDFNDGQLELTRRSCSDGMSDSIYGWSAIFELADKTYRGCATLSNHDHSANWVGHYQASSTTNTGFEVMLDLRTDHGATTTYRYLDGSGDLVERGYWQALSSQQAQVVMTHHQQQPLLSERLFVRDGTQLSTKQEKVGNVVYPIADGGLVLYKQAIEEPKQPLLASVSTKNSSTMNANTVPSSAMFNPKVDRTLRNYFDESNIDAEGSRYRWLTYDLNGDQQPELLVQLDWCGSGGCTLLVFENQQQKWRFNSRITLVNTPLNIGNQRQQGWQDLVIFVGGGGATPNQHRLQFEQGRYPLNPSRAPLASMDDLSSVQLFSDGLTPHQEGIPL